MPYARINGIELYYEVFGKGPVVVLAHGLCARRCPCDTRPRNEDAAATLPAICGKLCAPTTLRTGKAPMSNALEALQAEILRLSPADRARLLDRLIASLDVDNEAEAAWDALADKREKELDAGTVEAVPLDVAIARLEARFKG